MLKHRQSDYNKEQYYKDKEWLFKELGGVCAIAKRKNHICEGELQIDHIDGVTWVLNKVSSHIRIKKVIAEYKAGIRLRLLCKKANRRGGGFRRWI